MRTFFYVLSLTIFCAACSSSSLDKTFDPELYNGYYQKINTENEASKADLFLMNYAVLRQRSYHDYKVEGKTYGEIIVMAQDFSENGLPAEYVYEIPELPEGIEADIYPEGSGALRTEEGSSRLARVAKFAATLKNTTTKDVALLDASFIIKGPFMDYLTTAGYSINCKLEAGETVQLGFLLDARLLRDNAVYEQNYEVGQIDLETLFASLNIELGGLSIENDVTYFDRCIDTEARHSPFKTISFYEDMADKEWIKRDGETTQLLIGNTFLEREEEEIRTINLGR